MKENFSQFVKFATVGILNVTIDLGVLNGLMFFSGISAGPSFSLFKGISFGAALVNSYFWNKSWTFGRTHFFSWQEFLKFSAIISSGLLVNVTIASLLVNYLRPPWDFSPFLWANAAALLAAGLVFFWNFFGAKFIVFR